MECLLEYFLWTVCGRGRSDSLNKHGDKSLKIPICMRIEAKSPQDRFNSVVEHCSLKRTHNFEEKKNVLWLI